MNLDQKYPALSDLRAAAKKRIPKFVWEYLISATGSETTPVRNRRQLDKILFMPSILHGEFEPDTRTQTRNCCNRRRSAVHIVDCGLSDP